MRIGILCHDSFGGSARIATELASGLAKFGHQIHLFAQPAYYEMMQKFARERALNYGFEHIIPQYVDLYCELLNQKA